jgi:TPR repeat protein
MPGMFRAAALALAGYLATSVAGLAEVRTALIVGNSHYEAVGTLDNPVNDASDIAIALEGLGFEVYLGLDQTEAQMQALAAKFEAAAAQSDVALFYYAGHGFQVNGQNYLVPTDAHISSAEDVASQTLPVNEVLDAMEKSKGLRLVFLDACRNNPFGETPVGPQMSSGLARMGNAADFMVAYATQPDNVAYDGSGRNSFFTQAMLSHIYTPGQDMSDLMMSVRRDVMAATGGRQIPWENSSLTRQFRFDNSPVTASEETLLWQVAANADDPALMRLYLDRYPEGAHVGDVVAYLDQGDTGMRTRDLGLGDADAQAERLWQLAQRSRMRPLLEFYLDQYGQGAHADQARRLLQSLPPSDDTTPGGICERLTTHPRDATATQSGVPFAQLQRNAVAAIQACSAAAAQAPDLPHYTALLARATAATGDMGRAVQLYQQAAERGDLRAMVSLAQLRETGTGLPQDPAAAVALYQRAADAGSPDAMINLAVMLFEGKSLPQDKAKAVALLQQASTQGSAKATFNLGVLMQEGDLGDPGEALAYFRRAAQEGETAAYRAAAVLLDEGRGVPADPAAAADLLLRGAAEDNGLIVQQLSTAPGEWSRATLSAMQGRLQAAGYYTSAIDGRGGPGLNAALATWRNGGFRPDLLAP